MKKNLKIYKIGGKLYYSKGGRLYPYKKKGLPAKQQSGLNLRDQDAQDISNMMDSFNSATIDPNAGTGATYKDTFGTKAKNFANSPGVKQAAITGLSALTAAIPDASGDFDYGNEYYDRSRRSSDEATQQAQSKARSLAGGDYGSLFSSQTGGNIPRFMGGGMPWGQMGSMHTDLVEKTKPEEGADYNDTVGYKIASTFAPTPAGASRRDVSQKGTTDGEKFGSVVKNFLGPIFPFLNWIDSPSEKRAREAKRVSGLLAKEDKGRKQVLKGADVGTFKNTGIHSAKRGAYITKNSNTKPNAEIETGEGVFDKSGRMGQTELASKNATATNQSKFGAMFYGDRHDQDKDKDGQKGIVGKFPEQTAKQEGSYVFSDFLNKDGLKVRHVKKGGKVRKSGPSAADEAKPHLKVLADAENSKDPFKNNDKNTQNAYDSLVALEERTELGKDVTAVIEEFGFTEKDRPVVEEMVKRNPDAFRKMREQLDEAKPDVRTDIGKRGKKIDVKGSNSSRLSEQGMAAIGILTKIFQGSGMVEGELLEEETQEPAGETEVSEEDIITPINPTMKSLNDRLGGDAFVMDAASITGDEKAGLVLSNNVKTDLLKKGITEEELNNKSVNDLMKGTSGKIFSEIIQDKRKSEDNKQQNINTTTEGELPQQKNGGQMRRTRRLSRYQGVKSKISEKQKLDFMNRLYKAGRVEDARRYFLTHFKNKPMSFKTQGTEMVPVGPAQRTVQLDRKLNNRNLIAEQAKAVQAARDAGHTGMVEKRLPNRMSSMSALRPEGSTQSGRPFLNSNAGSPIYSGDRLIVPADQFSGEEVERQMTGGYNKMQMGQEVGPEQMGPGAESNEHMGELLGGEQGMEPGAEGMVDEAGQGGDAGGVDPAVLQQIQAHPVFSQMDAQLQQMIAQIAMQDPQAFEELMNMPPEQAEIAIQSMMGALAGGPEAGMGGGAPMGPEMGPEMGAPMGPQMGGAPMTARRGRKISRSKDFTKSTLNAVMKRFNA